MDPTQASDFQRVLDELMETVRSKPTLTSEVCRAEREFFQANPGARDHDPSAMMRFCEWFLLERESDVIGGVPVRLLPMPAADRQRLEDSLVGVFQIQGSNTDEYVVVDLQGDTSHDVAHVEGVTLSTGDLLIGRLFEGPLDVYVASVSMAYQRDARALAAAFTKDTQAMMNYSGLLVKVKWDFDRAAKLYRRVQARASRPSACPEGTEIS